MWNRTENQIRLVLIRHGKTIENREHRYLGKTDSPLNEDGYQALQKAVENKAYPKVCYLFSSPMKRCRQTAELIYPNVPCSVIPEWEEMDFGDFECKNYEELKDNDEYQKWIDSNGMIPFPNGESREAFVMRCKAGFQKMLCQLAEMEQFDAQGSIDNQEIPTIGMIVHGGTIMALLSEYYGGEYFDYQISNGCGYVCTMKLANKPRIVDVEKL